MSDALAKNVETAQPPAVPSIGRSRLLPVVVVLVLPAVFAAWWFFARDDADRVAQDEPVATTADQPDPWALIQQPIYPMGRIERIHHTDQFTFILFRSQESDRWVAISPTNFKTGDVVQLRVDPLAVKTDFPVKQLGRIFPTLVLAGQAKLIRSASD